MKLEAVEHSASATTPPQEITPASFQRADLVPAEACVDRHRLGVLSCFRCARADLELLAVELHRARADLRLVPLPGSCWISSGLATGAQMQAEARRIASHSARSRVFTCSATASAIYGVAAFRFSGVSQ